MWLTVCVFTPYTEALNNALAVDWTEREMYRIDRYLGKEVIDNLLVGSCHSHARSSLRFLNIEA